jgi:hypothetical protein
VLVSVNQTEEFRVSFVSDIPAQVPPLTPGTNKKMTEALKASFASWEKEQLRLNIVKGKVTVLTVLMQLFLFPLIVTHASERNTQLCL